MSAPPDAASGTLVCFAVRQEAAPFQKGVRGRRDVSILITGMGTRRAAEAVRDAIQRGRPARVFTCGFAGALNPDLQIGDVLFDSTDAALANQLRGAGGKPATFHLAERVVVTARQKQQLRKETSADGVEMESALIQRICAEHGIACTTVRVVSDLAHEDLPLDFNKLMDSDNDLSSLKLAAAILKAPHRIPALLRLGRHSATAARKLTEVLVKVI